MLASLGFGSGPEHVHADMAWMQIPWQQCWQLRLEKFSSTPRQPVGWHSLPRPEVPAAILGTMGWVFCCVTSRVAGILGAWGFDKYGTWGWLMGDVSSQLTVLTGMGMKQLGCSDAALCAPLFCSPVCEKHRLLVIWLGLGSDRPRAAGSTQIPPVRSSKSLLLSRQLP